MSSTNFSSTTEPVPPADRRAVSLISNPLFDLVRLAVAPKTAAGSPTAAWIRQRPVLALIGLAYGLTWIGLIPLIRNPGIASQANWSHAGNPAVLVYAFLGVLGCFWAAVIVASATGGLARRAALLRGYLHWRVGAQWYFAVVLLPIVLLGVAVALCYLMTGTLPTLALPSLLPSAMLSAYALFLGRYLIGNFEEICWRASLLPRLQAKYSALVSSLLVGLVQGFWHMPFALVRGHYVQVVGLPAMVLQSVAMSMVFTWVYNNTRGSLLLVALFHAAYDALSQFQGSDPRLLYVNIAVWSLAALVVLAVFGWRRLSRKPESELAYAIMPAGQ